jgi:hypothetical protein
VTAFVTTTFVSSSSAALFAAYGLGPSGSGALRLSALRGSGGELLGRLAAALLVEALQVLECNVELLASLAGVFGDVEPSVGTS